MRKRDIMQKSKNKINKKILFQFFLLGILSLLVIVLTIFTFQKNLPLQIDTPKNVVYDQTTNTLQFDSLTLKQKIAQMIITYGNEDNKELLQKMLVGGVHLGAKSSKEEFLQSINTFQKGSILPFFITLDLEGGCKNPFENFQSFPSAKEIKTAEEAYAVGYDEGRLLKEMGFTINFAPVVDLKDSIWNCRSFSGTLLEASKKTASYILGLQSSGILATAKHYPGKTLSSNDPHKTLTYADITLDDVAMFENSIQNNVSAIMISHVIVRGILDSESKPGVVSDKLITNLKNQFTGLIISDEVMMLGLNDYYSDKDQMYIDLFKAGNDLVLNFNQNPKEIYHMITVVGGAVRKGIISEKKIDTSVKKILQAKGIQIEYSKGGLIENI